MPTWISIIPNTPVQMTAGIQAFDYGGRLFMNNDAPGVKVRTDFAPHSVEFFWGRIADQAYGRPANDPRAMYGVFDVYGVEYNLKQKAWDLNAYFAYQNDLWSGWQATIADPITYATFRSSTNLTTIRGGRASRAGSVPGTGPSSVTSCMSAARGSLKPAA